MTTLKFIDDLVRSLPKLDAERAGERLYGAPRLSMFDVLGDGELQLSRVYAMLLDPAGAHGQGVLFLNAFLKLIGLPPVRSEDRIEVHLEHSTEVKRRIDIVIVLPTCIVGIENKPWAGLQEAQLSDYHLHLGGWKKSDMRLVYLCQWEASAEDRPELAGDDPTFVHVPFAGGEGSMSSCLQSVLGEVKAERTRYFVKDIVEHMERRMGGVEMAPEPLTEEIRTRLRNDADSLRAVSGIIADQNFVRDMICDRLGQVLLDEIPDHYVMSTYANGKFEPLDRGRSEFSRMGWRKHSNWLFSNPRWPGSIHLCFENENNSRNSVIFGIRAPSQDSRSDEPCQERERLDQALESVRSSFKMNQWWAAWAYLAPGDWSVEGLARFTYQADGAPKRHPSFVENIALIKELCRLMDAAFDPQNQSEFT